MSNLETPVTASPAILGMADRNLLIVEDDKAFLERLARAMEARGFIVRTSELGRRRSGADRARRRRRSLSSTSASATATASTWSRH